MRAYALSAMGVDRPGIVAAIAERLLAHGVNVTDSHMGILRGHFAMTLIVEAADAVDEQALRADLTDAAGRLGLEALSLAAVAEAASAAPSEPTHIVTVYGADHPGIVAAVTRALADAAVNVCDLQTRLAGELYVMFIEVAAPAGVPEDALCAVAAGQGVDISVRPVEAEIL